MNTELEKKLVDDLRKTGFASEMKAIQILNNAGWTSSSSRGYFDKDEQKTRELDIEAYRLRSEKVSNSNSFDFFFHLAMEIKKSKEPWVVFKQPLQKWENLDAWNNLIFSENLPDEPSKFAKDLSFNSLVLKNKWQGSGIHEAFKKPEQPSRWYTAFVSCCKGAEDILAANSSESDKTKWVTDDFEKRPPEIYFIKPVVVLDGILISASLSKTGEVLLEEITSAAFSFTFRTNSYKRSSYSIDLVTLEWLHEYIKLSELRQDHIFNSIMLAGTQMKVKRHLTSNSS
jgi:hypothetical protein